MTPAIGILIAFLLFVLTLASYVDRMYSEMGKFLSREFQENIDAWEQLVQPRLGMDPERIALSAAVLTQLSLACVTLLFGAVLFVGFQLQTGRAQQRWRRRCWASCWWW